MKNQNSTHTFLQSDGSTGQQIADYDWSEHPLGPIGEWSRYLRMSLGIVLNSAFPAYIMWGEEFFVLYNDAYIPILGNKTRLGQGVPLVELWSEIKEAACAIAQHALSGKSTKFIDQPFLLERNGAPEQAYFTFSYSPIRDDSGNALGVICMIVETTEKVIAHALLKENEDRLRISLEASGSIGTWSYDPETNETIVDDRFCALFQVDAALGQDGTRLERFTNMIHQDDRDRVLESITQSINNGTFYDIEYRIPQRSGKIVWVNARGRMFGKRFAGVAVDVTDKKASNDKLRQFAADLSETSHRKTEFLATLAHELRNPLAPLRTGLELMRVSMDNPVTLSKIQTMMQRQVDQMVHLVDDLMDISRINSGKIELKNELMDVKIAISSAIEATLPHIERAKHQLTVEVPAGPLLITADPTRVAQVLGNVLTNAAKYTPAGGHIKVAAYNESENLVVEISDSGIGLPAEALLDIFEMFSQFGRDTTHSAGGLGVGLALVRQLVELHGGTVSAFSQGRDKGSTFRIEIPLHSSQVPAGGLPDQLPVSERKTSASKIRILVADDNSDAAETLATLLMMDGHEVQIAEDGNQAFALAQSFRPNLIFMDIGMPGQNGHEVARRIRAIPSLHAIKLVALTGWGTDQDRTLSSNAGFDKHLTKPIGFEDVQGILQSMKFN